MVEGFVYFIVKLPNVSYHGESKLNGSCFTVKVPNGSCFHTRTSDLFFGSCYIVKLPNDSCFILEPVTYFSFMFHSETFYCILIFANLLYRLCCFSASPIIFLISSF
jgi:hypothetical protein